jgi:hypothetical protein
MTICRGPLLPIEDAGDHTIGVIGCPASAPVRQKGRVEEGRISGPS